MEKQELQNADINNLFVFLDRVELKGLTEVTSFMKIINILDSQMTFNSQNQQNQKESEVVK